MLLPFTHFTNSLFQSSLHAPISWLICRATVSAGRAGASSLLARHSNSFTSSQYVFISSLVHYYSASSGCLFTQYVGRERLRALLTCNPPAPRQPSLLFLPPHGHSPACPLPGILHGLFLPSPLPEPIAAWEAPGAALNS